MLKFTSPLQGQGPYCIVLRNNRITAIQVSMSVHDVIKFDTIKRKSAVEGSLEFVRGNALQSTTLKQHLADCQSHRKMEVEPPVLLSSNFWFPQGIEEMQVCLNASGSNYRLKDPCAFLHF